MSLRIFAEILLFSLVAILFLSRNPNLMEVLERLITSQASNKFFRDIDFAVVAS
jgi:hypothetical protein